MHPQCAFRSLFIDASRMTPEVQRVVTDTGDGGWKTTRKWEEFILAASVSWHVFQKSQSRGVRDIREGSDEDSASSTSGLYLPDEPSMFKFAELQAFGDVHFQTDFPVEPGEEEDTKHVHRQELYELQSVVMAIDNKLRLFVESVCTDQVGSMEHLWLSITHLGSALDAVLSRVRGVENEVGDKSDLMDDFNLTDLSKGFTMALNQANTGGGTQLVEFQERIVDLQEKVGDLEKLILAVDDDHQKAGRFLLRKLRELSLIRAVRLMGPLPSPSPLQSSTTRELRLEILP